MLYEIPSTNIARASSRQMNYDRKCLYLKEYDNMCEEDLFLYELLKQIDFCNIAYQRLEELLNMQSNNNEIWYSVQAFLV
jgi:hypothetical protein